MKAAEVEDADVFRPAPSVGDMAQRPTAQVTVGAHENAMTGKVIAPPILELGSRSIGPKATRSVSPPQSRPALRAYSELGPGHMTYIPAWLS